MPTVDTASTEEVVDRPDLGWDPENPAAGYRVLEFRQGGDTYRIRISDTQRFTFGPFTPGGKNNYGSADNALRIYEGANKENQIAVFRGVDSVRDVSVPLAKLLKTRKGEATEEVGPDGSKRQSRVERSQAWVAVGGGMRADEDIPF